MKLYQHQIDALEQTKDKNHVAYYLDMGRHDVGHHEMHGLRKHPLYSVWANIKTRCFNRNNSHYERWGGRGITMCNEWKNSFKAFYNWAMSNGYQEGLTIDRIDNDGNYEPSNCRWVTVKIQNSNKRNVKFITYNGETKLLGEWAQILGIKEKTLWMRLYYYNMPIEKAFMKGR